MVTNNSKNQPTGAAGKVMQGQGVGTAANFSTATYPSTATGTGKILRADGTNWVASTATYPDTAGTSGNVLTSDGTNWVSSTPASGVFVNGIITCEVGNPADSTTYYFGDGFSFIQFTTALNGNIQLMTPVNCTINRINGSFNVAGTLASAQNCTLFIRVNDTTNTNISTTLQLTSASVSVTNNSLGLSLNAGDFFIFGFTGPAWTTNPTTVSMSLSFSS